MALARWEAAERTIELFQQFSSFVETAKSKLQLRIHWAKAAVLMRWERLSG